MQRKTRNWLIGAGIAIGATAIILGSVLGTQLNQHYSNNELAATTNANNTTANSKATNATKTKNKVDDSNSVTNNTKTLLPLLYEKNDNGFSVVGNNEVSNESNAGYYLSPNLTTTTNQTITFIWYGSKNDVNYGGDKLGVSTSDTNSGYFQLTTSMLNQYSYYYYVAQITDNGTIINSNTSNDLKVTLTNPINISSLTINLDGNTITSLSSEYLLTTSDTFNLKATTSIPTNATNISYQWYATTNSGTNLTQLQDANDVTSLGSSTTATFALNQNIINAKFTTFFVEVSATVNGQTYTQTDQTSLTYNDTNEISNANITLSNSTVYIGQQNDYATITLSYTVNAALEGKAYSVQFYGVNPYVNGESSTGTSVIGQTSGTISTSSDSGQITFNLSNDNAFYGKYYAVITVANYAFTTQAVTQNIKQAYTTSNNNTPSIVNNNNSTSNSNKNTDSTPSTSQSSSTKNTDSSSDKTSTTNSDSKTATSSSTSSTKNETPITPTLVEKLASNSINLQDLVNNLKISNIATFYNNYYAGQYTTDLATYLTNSSDTNITLSDLVTNISDSKANNSWGDVTGFKVTNNSKDIVQLETNGGVLISTINPGDSSTITLPASMDISMNLPTSTFANSSVTWVMGNLINDKSNTIAYGPARAFWSQSRYGGNGYLFSFFGIDNYDSYNYGFKYGINNEYTMDTTKWSTYQWGLTDGYILMSWVAQILGWNESNQDVLSAYKVYIPVESQSGSIIINEVKFNNTWYDTDFTIACGSGFLLW